MRDALLFVAIAYGLPTVAGLRWPHLFQKRDGRDVPRPSPTTREE